MKSNVTSPVAQSLLISVLLLSACDGSSENGPSAGPGNTAPGFDDGNTFGSSMEGEAEANRLFPEPGPIVDPASSPEEIASLTDSLVAEYRTLMLEVFRQMDEVYRTIGSGLETSEDPRLIAEDARFYEAINTYCTPEFDNTGTMIALRGCSYRPAEFELRHPLYSSIRVLVAEYTLGAVFEEKAETDVTVGGGGSLRITTGPARLSTVAARNPPSFAVETPAYLGDRCSVFLEPTRFPEDDLRVNECSKVLRDTLTVLQRLNDPTRARLMGHDALPSSPEDLRP